MEWLIVIITTLCMTIVAFFFNNRDLQRQITGLNAYIEQKAERHSEELDTLQAKLEKSQRNDTPKDPKTGRFMKKGK